MARIEPPGASGMGEHVDWSLHRTEMAIGMGKFSEAVYGNSQLPLREREAARWTIALINDCVVCQDTRAKDAEAHAIDEGFYAEVADWATTDALTEREKLAAEFAQRFALDHQAMDDEFWARLRGDVHRRRGRRPHHLLRDVPRPGPRHGGGRRAGARTSASWSDPDERPGGPMAAHDLIIRGGTVLDGTGSPARTADVAVTDGIVTEVGQVDGARHPGARRRRPARHARPRRHPRALRRPGHLGRPPDPVVLARRHHRRGRQLRRRLRAGAARPTTTGSSSSWRASRTSPAPRCTRGCRGPGSRSPSSSTRSTAATTTSTSPPTSPTARCAST